MLKKVSYELESSVKVVNKYYIHDIYSRGKSLPTKLSWWVKHKKKEEISCSLSQNRWNMFSLCFFSPQLWCAEIGFSVSTGKIEPQGFVAETDNPVKTVSFVPLYLAATSSFTCFSKGGLVWKVVFWKRLFGQILKQRLTANTVLLTPTSAKSLYEQLLKALSFFTRKV